jgi:plasmid replication initiation protein
MTDSNVIETNSKAQLPTEFFKMAHKLVFSQLSLSSREHDILALVLGRLNKDHWADFEAGKNISSPRYRFGSSVLCEWLGVEPKHLFSTLKAPAKRLSERKIGVVSDTKSGFAFIPLFKNITYEDGVLLIVPNDELIREYLGISQGHAKLNHTVFRSLKSEHSKRLYSMLSRFKTQATKLHPQSITSLHGFFGLLNEEGDLIKKSYANNNTFIERCIRKSIREIHKYDPKLIFGEYSEGKTREMGFIPIRAGRSIVSIEFLFSWLGDVKEERRELKKLADTGQIDDYLELIYNMIDDYIPEQNLTPTMEELNLLSNNLGVLIEQGKNIDKPFMVKLSKAKEKAYLIVQE